MHYLGIIRLEFENTFVIFEINTLEFVSSVSFVQKLKILKYGTKSTWFWYFWVLEILLSNLKSVPWNLSISKISCKNENA